MSDVGPRSSSDWMELEKKYYMFTVRRQPVVIEKGDGSWVWDVEGNEYLDFCAGWAVDNLGHSHPAITSAIMEQASTLLQTSNQFYTLPQLRLAQLLVENSALDKVFFSNSGAEAVEGVIKLARKHGKKTRDGAYEIITANHSFHGRTLTALSATGNPHYQEPFQPVTPGFVHVDYDNVEAIMEATNDRTAAVLLEPVQGEGGVNVPADDYFKRVRDWCDSQGLLLVLDEVQTGFGRLGSLFGYQQFGIEPDAMALGKGSGRRSAHRRFHVQGRVHGSGARRPRLHLRRECAHLRRRLRLDQSNHRPRSVGQRPCDGTTVNGRAGGSRLPDGNAQGR